MTPIQKLKLNFAIFTVLAFYWYLDQPQPDPPAFYETAQPQLKIPEAPFVEKKERLARLAQLSVLNTQLRNINQQHIGQTGLYLFKQSEETLAAQRSLIDQASERLDIVLSDWGRDRASNLLAASLISASERGLKIRILIEDRAIDYHDKVLFALSRHPLIEIRVYDPQHRVGSHAGRLLWRYFSFLTSKRYRLMEQSFLVDDEIAIQASPPIQDPLQGRDYLVMGTALAGMRKHFDQVWQHPKSLPFSEVFDEHPFIKHNYQPHDKKINLIYQSLQAFAASEAQDTPQLSAFRSGDALLQDLHTRLNWSPSSYWHAASQQTFDHHHFERLFNTAEQEIFLLSNALPFSTSQQLALTNAAQRGVKVYLMTPSLTARYDTRAYHQFRLQCLAFIAAGIEIKTLTETAHAKDSHVAAFPQIVSIDGKQIYSGNFQLAFDERNPAPASGILLKDLQQATTVANDLRALWNRSAAWSEEKEERELMTLSWSERLFIRTLNFWQSI